MHERGTQLAQAAERRSAFWTEQSSGGVRRLKGGDAIFALRPDKVVLGDECEGAERAARDFAASRTMTGDQRARFDVERLSDASAQSRAVAGQTCRDSTRAGSAEPVVDGTAPDALVLPG